MKFKEYLAEKKYKMDLEGGIEIDFPTVKGWEFYFDDVTGGEYSKYFSQNGKEIFVSITQQMLPTYKEKLEYEIKTKYEEDRNSNFEESGFLRSDKEIVKLLNKAEKKYGLK